jgi:hypothetical protein
MSGNEIEKNQSYYEPYISTDFYYQKIIKKSPQLRKIFKDQPLCSFRRNTNLANIMVQQKTAKVLKKNPLPESRLQGNVDENVSSVKKVLGEN